MNEAVGFIGLETSRNIMKRNYVYVSDDERKQNEVIKSDSHVLQNFVNGEEKKILMGCK